MRRIWLENECKSNGKWKKTNKPKYRPNRDIWPYYYYQFLAFIPSFFITQDLTNEELIIITHYLLKNNNNFLKIPKSLLSLRSDLHVQNFSTSGNLTFQLLIIESLNRSHSLLRATLIWSVLHFFFQTSCLWKWITGTTVLWSSASLWNVDSPRAATQPESVIRSGE